MPLTPFAVLSDIHSNLDALDAVCADLDASGIGNVVCLGDIVGYAAYPEECTARVRERGWPTVLGNHDAAIGDDDAQSAMNNIAVAGIQFAERQVSAPNREWLSSLPMSFSRHRTIFTHASLDQSEAWPYLIDVASCLLHFLRQRIPMCFVGHTHRPMVLRWERKTRLQSLIPGSGPIRLPETGKTTVNVGSVGQPRDGDPRASYAIYHPDSRELQLRRVAYDIRAAQKAIRKAGLPSFAARRLAHGE